MKITVRKVEKVQTTTECSDPDVPPWREAKRQCL